MSGIGEGQQHAMRSMSDSMYLKTGDPGNQGGGTYTGQDADSIINAHMDLFGPAGRDIKIDSQRSKRHQRWHLSDVKLPASLNGRNDFMTKRIDGLISDSTNSPFTTVILPYVHLEYPDHKIKWQVYSFDEGIASRVPYEAAARVLPQTKRSFAGYVVRQGLAIAMEHNFMVSPEGRENFKNQLTQLVGSIQMTNDLDVHVALLQAPSYQKHINEKYYDVTRTTAQVCRQYVDLFGIMQKIPNALDILIEDAKNHLKTWGSQPPSFLLCNGNLTTQLTMVPEKTNYITNGPEGAKRLANGPDLNSYRGLSIINTRKFSMDAGTKPRDLLRRRVRVAEYYRIPGNKPGVDQMEFEFYDQSRDSMFRLSYEELVRMSKLGAEGRGDGGDDDNGGSNSRHSAHWRMMGNSPSQEYDLLTQMTTAVSVNTKSVFMGLTTHGVLNLPTAYLSTDEDALNMSNLPPDDVQPTDELHEQSNVDHGVGYNLGNQQALYALTKKQQTYQAANSEAFGGGIWNDPYTKMTQNYDGYRWDSIKAGWPVVERNLPKGVVGGGGAAVINAAHGMSSSSQYTAVYGINYIVDNMMKNYNIGTHNNHLHGGNACTLDDLLCNIKQGSIEHLKSMVKSANPMVVPRLRKIAKILYLRKQHGHPEAVTSYQTRYDNAVTPKVKQSSLYKIREDGADHDDEIFAALEVSTFLTEVLFGEGEVKFTETAVNIHNKAWVLTAIQNGKTDGELGKMIAAVTALHTNGGGGQSFKEAMVNAAINKDPLIIIAAMLTISEHADTNFNRQNRFEHTGSPQPCADIDCALRTQLMEFHERNPSIALYTTAAGNPKFTSGPMKHIYNLNNVLDAPLQVINVMDPVREWVMTEYPGQNTKTWIQTNFHSMTHGKEDVTSIIQLAYAAVLDTVMTCALDQLEQQLFARADGNFVPPQPFSGMAREVETWHKAMVTDAIQYVLFRCPVHVAGNANKHLSTLGMAMSDDTMASNLKLFSTEFKATVKHSMKMGEDPAFLHEMTANMILAEFDNMSGAQISLCAPNLHTSTCDPLKESDKMVSASSTDGASWVMQQAMGTMFLDGKTCRRLLTNCGSGPLPTNLYNDFFNSADKTDRKTMNTLLMHWFMSEFHPTTITRSQALGRAGSKPSGDRIHKFCMALANAIEKNNCCDTDLKEAMYHLFYSDMHSHGDVEVPYYGKCATQSNHYLPAWVSTDELPYVGTEININYLPIHQFNNVSGVQVTPKGDANSAHFKHWYTNDLASVMHNRGAMALPLLNDCVKQDSSSNEHMVYRVCGDEGRGEMVCPLSMCVDNYTKHVTQVMPWVRSLTPCTKIGTNKYLVSFSGDSNYDHPRAQAVYDDSSAECHSSALSAIAYLRNIDNCNTVWRHLLMVLAQRFFRDTRRFMYNGEGVDVRISSTEGPTRAIAGGAGVPPLGVHYASVGIPGAAPGGAGGAPTTSTKDYTTKLFRHGLHFSHGPNLPTTAADSSAANATTTSGAVRDDLLILRPNIEHEMLGIIMGRGGTQELGCTFWGQTELSCYDDAQHGVWGMSYKYHERAIVTNERNLIRTFDVAFDGYNGGMDQTYVDWNDPQSLQKFRDATYARDRPYTGPSMLVMALPNSANSTKNWPNPIVFHSNVSGNLSIDPQKDETLPDISEHMVFNAHKCGQYCSQEQQAKYEQYMSRLGMNMWTSLDQTTRPAGESCISNESASNMLAFQGQMGIIDGKGGRSEVMGSGHLGPSFVGCASVREGRGILNTAQQPQMVRQI